MSEPDTVVAERLSDGTVVQVMPDGSYRPLESNTDWARLAAMTEEEIEANALSDPDNPPLTAEELARPVTSSNPQSVRHRLRMTQEVFAASFNIPLGTLRDWEQGKKWPDSAARTLLRVIDHNPEAVLAALGRELPAAGADAANATVGDREETAVASPS